jgi:hypothetical protein
MAALKRVLRYIVESINLGCFYRLGEGKAKLVGYYDSDYAGDVDDSHDGISHCTIGLCVPLHGGYEDSILEDNILA